MSSHHLATQQSDVALMRGAAASCKDAFCRPSWPVAAARGAITPLGAATVCRGVAARRGRQVPPRQAAHQRLVEGARRRVVALQDRPKDVTCQLYVVKAVNIESSAAGNLANLSSKSYALARHCEVRRGRWLNGNSDPRPCFVPQLYICAHQGAAADDGVWLPEIRAVGVADAARPLPRLVH